MGQDAVKVALQVILLISLLLLLLPGLCPFAMEPVYLAVAFTYVPPPALFVLTGFGSW